MFLHISPKLALSIILARGANEKDRDQRERKRERVHWGVDAMPNKGKCVCGAAFRARCQCAEGTPGSFKEKPKNERQSTKRVASEVEEAPGKAQATGLVLSSILP